MDKLNDVKHVRAIALQAASRIVAENLRFMDCPSGYASSDQEARSNIDLSVAATIRMARQFENYLTGVQDARVSR